MCIIANKRLHISITVDGFCHYHFQLLFANRWRIKIDKHIQKSTDVNRTVKENWHVYCVGLITAIHTWLAVMRPTTKTYTYSQKKINIFTEKYTSITGHIYLYQ